MSIGTSILQQDIAMARAMNARLTGIQKGLSHALLGEKLRSAITTQTITSDIVSSDIGLPYGDRGLIVGLTA